MRKLLRKLGRRFPALKALGRRLAPFAFLGPQGDLGIAQKGHRGYVGGLWEHMGKLQFDFLCTHGLRPSDYLLDIACGSLRLGVRAIPYLEPGHYLGMEKEEALVRAGLENELPARVREEKRPNIVVSKSFEFEKLRQKANYAIAQSLFSHLPPELIELCFRNLYEALMDDAHFYATFFETRRDARVPRQAHDHGYFAYTRSRMCEFGQKHGFVSKYIGDWNHPRDQVMVEYVKPAAT